MTELCSVSGCLADAGPEPLEMEFICRSVALSEPGEPETENLLLRIPVCPGHLKQLRAWKGSLGRCE